MMDNCYVRGDGTIAGLWAIGFEGALAHDPSIAHRAPVLVNAAGRRSRIVNVDRKNNDVEIESVGEPLPLDGPLPGAATRVERHPAWAEDGGSIVIVGHRGRDFVLEALQFYLFGSDDPPLGATVLGPFKRGLMATRCDLALAPHPCAVYLPTYVRNRLWDVLRFENRRLFAGFEQELSDDVFIGLGALGGFLRAMGANAQKRADRHAWLLRMGELEEELGEFPAGGAAGGVIAKARREGSHNHRNGSPPQGRWSQD
jgi:hypothetical protein